MTWAMHLRAPLLAKILVWLFLNLVIVAGGLLLVFKMQYEFGLDSLLAGRAGERLQAVGDAVAGELKDKPPGAWGPVLKNFSKAYGLDFLLFRSDATQFAGETVRLPQPVATRLSERHGPGFGLGRGPPPGRGPPRGPAGALAGPFARFIVKTVHPTEYWAGLRLSLTEPGNATPWPLFLILRSNSLSAGGLFIDLKPWALAACGALLFSALFWIPLVRGLTKSVAQMTRVTEHIAQGNFEVKVAQQRGDELGRLGQAINTMAARLSGFVSGQKRFLGDVAHELCSPIARIQVALGILEQRADEKQRAYVEDVREEVQHMSQLINDLLSFSKAGLAQKAIQLKPVNVQAITQAAVERETPEPGRVMLEVDGALSVLAEPDLLFRAVSNLVRNSLRYASESGSITVRASLRDSQVAIVIADEGPGVPESSLQQIFDPFFRGEASRSRETGGVGLGLAIVKTCVEACRGTVCARNRSPRGLEVMITLPVAETVPAVGERGEANVISSE